MPVIRLSRPNPSGRSGTEPTPPLGPGPVVRVFGRQGDDRRVIDLARASASEAAPPRPLGEGLLAELTGTATRPVVAWLAIDGADPLGPAVGVVALVASGLASRRRHSISWLVVHPAARRQGIGRLLVAQACRHAWEGAADRVWVECRSDWSAALAFWQTLGFFPHVSESS